MRCDEKSVDCPDATSQGFLERGQRAEGPAILVELPGWEPESPLSAIEAKNLAGLAPGTDGYPGYAQHIRESFGREHVILGTDFLPCPPDNNPAVALPHNHMRLLILTL